MNPLKRILTALASLRLTVLILSAALVLVFAGTIAQVKFGLWAVQEQYFQSWFIWWSPGWADSPDWVRIPVYPGGHLIGAALLVNLAAAYVVRFSWSLKKAGIQLVHLGLIIMLVGGLATDLFSVSSYMRLREGETKNYSEEDMAVELAIIEINEAGKQAVTVIPSDCLAKGEVISHPSLPFRIKVLESHRNSSLSMIGHAGGEGMKPAATQGVGARIALKAIPLNTRMDGRNSMSAVIELTAADGSGLGTWLVCDQLAAEQAVQVGERSLKLGLRPVRHYKPYSLTLLDFTHETYPGTSIPKDFSSTVMLNDEARNEHRKVRIFMNHPLRHDGDTYYQSGFEQDNMGTVLQVVRNPSYQAPYVACVVMSVGMIWQFVLHLAGFIRRKQKTLPS